MLDTSIAAHNQTRAESAQSTAFAGGAGDCLGHYSVQLHQLRTPGERLSERGASTHDSDSYKSPRQTTLPLLIQPHCRNPHPTPVTFGNPGSTDPPPSPPPSLSPAREVCMCRQMPRATPPIHWDWGRGGGRGAGGGSLCDARCEAGAKMISRKSDNVIYFEITNYTVRFVSTS